jgi:hypothetical protein
MDLSAGYFYDHVCIEPIAAFIRICDGLSGIPCAINLPQNYPHRNGDAAGGCVCTISRGNIQLTPGFLSTFSGSAARSVLPNT